MLLVVRVPRQAGRQVGLLTCVEWAGLLPSDAMMDLRLSNRLKRLLLPLLLRRVLALADGVTTGLVTTSSSTPPVPPLTASEEEKGGGDAVDPARLLHGRNACESRRIKPCDAGSVILDLPCMYQKYSRGSSTYPREEEEGLMSGLAGSRGLGVVSGKYDGLRRAKASM